MVPFVTGILFSQDGLLRVLLDGGPSRVFSLGDEKLFEEDLEVLKVCETLWLLKEPENENLRMKNIT